MTKNNSTAMRILTAQANHCHQLAAELDAAHSAGASAEAIADLEAQHTLAQRRYQELAVDLPQRGIRAESGSAQRGDRPWWRFW